MSVLGYLLFGASFFLLFGELVWLLTFGYWHGLIAFLAILSMALGAGIIVERITRLGELRRSLYADYLAGFNAESLIAAQQSPAFDERSKEAIRSFLNSNHPGWRSSTSTSGN